MSITTWKGRAPFWNISPYVEEEMVSWLAHKPKQKTPMEQWITNKEGMYLDKEFRVGDRVRVREDLVVDKEYGEEMYISPMNAYKGKIFTVTEIYADGTITLSNISWRWTTPMLELVSPGSSPRMVMWKNFGDADYNYGFVKEKGDDLVRVEFTYETYKRVGVRGVFVPAEDTLMNADMAVRQRKENGVDVTTLSWGDIKTQVRRHKDDPYDVEVAIHYAMEKLLKENAEKLNELGSIKVGDVVNVANSVVKHLNCVDWIVAQTRANPDLLWYATRFSYFNDANCSGVFVVRHIAPWEGEFNKKLALVEEETHPYRCYLFDTEDLKKVNARV